jgi:flagellar hook assembly protein FlgD
MTNAPNPFNPRTTLSFVLESAGSVSLKVYDVSGRLVRTLLNETRGAGPVSAVWDGTDEQGRPAASGVYLARMESRDRALTRRMTLVR